MYSRKLKHQHKKNRVKLIFLLLVTLILVCLAFLTFRLTQQTKPSSNTGTITHASTSQAIETDTPTTQTKETSVTWDKQDEPVQLPILMYHAIHDMAPSEAANANLIVSPMTFESHLKALKEAGYYTVTPEEAYKILTENVLPNGNKKIVWLTFDDGNPDFYTQAYPLLKQYGIKATNNIITSFAQNETGLTISQMKEMQQYGMSFQSHTVNHPDLSQTNPTLQLQELAGAKSYLDSELAQTTLAIAYPSGRYTQDTISLVEQAGYKLAVTTNPGLASLDDGLLTLDRIRVNPTTTAESLLAEMAGN